MFKHHFTLFYILKAAICFFGYVWSVLLNQPSTLLLTVCLLSIVAAPLMAWLESKQ